MLARRPKISAKVAQELIVMMVNRGNHYNGIRGRTPDDVKRIFESQGYDWQRLVEYCRLATNNVPHFENLIGSTWKSNGASISSVDLQTGEETPVLSGSGEYTQSVYWAQYEMAADALLRAIEKASYTEFQSAVVHGVASIEAYVNYRALEYNKRNSDNLLIDNKQHLVSLDKKIEEWIPRMCNGKLHRGGKEWEAFVRLRGIRDDQAIHPKAATYGITFSELASLINSYRLGIPGLLIQLHNLFNEPIPARIIRGRFMPEVEVVEEVIPN